MYLYGQLDWRNKKTMTFWQIFIRASNFVFRAPNLEGGFAIIDNIEYYGELCSGSLNFVTDTVSHCNDIDGLENNYFFLNFYVLHYTK